MSLDVSDGAWTLSDGVGIGKLTRISDPPGRTTSVTIDSSGNLTSVVLPEMSTISVVDDDNLERILNGAGRVGEVLTGRAPWASPTRVS